MAIASPDIDHAARFAGVWTADPVHSSLRFAVRHVISTFRGELPDFEAELHVGEDGFNLLGEGRVSSIQTADETLSAHLFAPDFFDIERYPKIGLRSGSLHLRGDAATVEAELTIKGTTRSVVLAGSLAGPVEDPFGGVRISLDLETAIDRRDFGLDWNMPLPGGGSYLGDEVVLTAELELVKEA